MKIFKYFSCVSGRLTISIDNPQCTVFIGNEKHAVALYGTEDEILAHVVAQNAAVEMHEINEEEFLAIVASSNQIASMYKYIEEKIQANLSRRSNILANPVFDECLYKLFLKNDYLKEIARERISLNIGDDRDLVADVSKRLGLLERMIMWCFADLMTTGTISQENKDAYLVPIQMYLGAVQGGLIVDRVDLEDKNELMNKLMERCGGISNIVQGSYLQHIPELPTSPAGE